MKDILQKLIKEYYGTDIIQKKVIIIGDGVKQQVHIFDALMAQEWGLQTGDRKPDIDASNIIAEKRRRMKAEQLFRRTMAILKFKNLESEWQKIYGKPIPDISKSAPHEELMQFSEGALYHLDIITPFDYTEMTAIVDEKGILQGMQIHPKVQDDITDGALNRE